MGIIKNNRILKKGFTLIEMTLVVAVFSILIVVTAEVFISFYQISVKTAASRDLGQNLRYSMETITREIRSAEKLEPYVSDVTPYGADAASYIPSDWDEDLNAGDIKILTREGKNILFYCKNDGGARCSEDNPGSLWQKNDFDDPVQLTPDNLSIIEYQIQADGTISEGNEFDIQPKVTIFVRAKSGMPDRAGDYPTISIKNTISKRNYHDLSYCGLAGCGMPVISSFGSGLAMLKSDGTVWQCGDSTNLYPYPILVTSDDNTLFKKEEVISVSRSANHTLALKKDGTVWAWGTTNYNGQIGIGTSDQLVRRNPVQVKSPDGLGYLTNIKSISTGWSNSFAIEDGGKVLSWGQNSTGVLGYGLCGETTSYLPNYVTTSGCNLLDKIIKVSPGKDAHTLFLDTDGYVWAVGKNNLGQTGQGNISNMIIPAVKVKSSSGTGFLENIVDIATGDNFSLALDTSGRVWAWGSNGMRQLGDGSTSTYKALPVLVKNSSGTGTLSEITEVAAGHYHALALDTSGRVWAWGSDQDCQLGRGGPISNCISTSVGPLPASVVSPLGGNLNNVRSIIGGTRLSFVMKNDGTVWGWGANLSSGTLCTDVSRGSKTSIPLQVKKSIDTFWIDK